MNRRLEARWPCPVCLGVKMEKTAIDNGSSEDGPLLLDHCPRCGGMWFELGEIQRLRSEKPEALWAQIPTRDEPHRAQCHSCRAVIDRDAHECATCGAKTHLDCPECDERMEQVRHGALTLDVCKRCKGVWFDHHELEQIWSIERDKLLARRKRGGLRRAGDEGSDILLETLVWAPDLVFVGAHAAGHAVAAAVEAAPGAIEVVGEAAASVFEV
ncbi:MAG: zf-TFIIB domain-containing protein, partial [Gemmatimonadetes bacterium]|nr:zf-TFIIB domain-containing protein [Gemmatimonadota bacterium]